MAQRGRSGSRGGSYGGQKRRPGGGVGTRVTGLFRSKKRGLYVGTARLEQELPELIKVIKGAKAKNLGVVFFLWKNTFEDDSKEGPVFTLKAGIEQPRPGAKGRDDWDDDDDDDDGPAEIEEEPEAADDDDLPF